VGRRRRASRRTKDVNNATVAAGAFAAVIGYIGLVVVVKRFYGEAMWV
jgi:hypothetical protein